MSVKMTEHRYSDRQIVERDMEALYLGNLNTVEFDLELPVKGSYGSDIRWESGHERFLDTDGRVSRPPYGMGNREVTLTGFFSCGDICMEKQYQVTILEQKGTGREKAPHPVIPMKDPEQMKASERVSECKNARIRILPGNEFYDTQERMHRYLLKLEDDRMLYHFRKASGLDTLGAESPDGWDSEECKLRGHTTGHYLSALALCYRAAGDERIRDKVRYMVHELGVCQQAFSRIEGIGEGFLSGYSEEQFDLLERYTPYPRIWAPYYTLHKIIAGLLDCFRYIGLEEALDIAERMGLWTYRRLAGLPKKQLDRMWGMYIAGEFGGMNAVMAELAGLTGRDEFIQCARLFDNDKLFQPLLRRQDMLEGMHANQHIPQILGTVELYKATGEKHYLEIGEVFWTTVVKNRAYAPGGVGEGEMFRGFQEIGGLLTANTQETCASYNMLKLTKELYQLGPDARYMDYYERTLLNHILASPAKEDSGESTYFFPLGPGMKREFFRENHCCHGTGMENHFRYQEGIYYERDGELYINLYIPSELCFDGREGMVRIKQVSRRRQCFRIQINGCDFDRVHIRRPEWAGAYSVREGDRRLRLQTNKAGYLTLQGDFTEERQITVEWNPHFRMIRTPDEPKLAAVQYGPYILAALSDREEFLEVSFCEADIGQKMMWENESEDTIHFHCDGWKWIPIYEVDKEIYHVYVVCPT